MIRLTENEIEPACRMMMRAFRDEPIFPCMFPDDKTRDTFTYYYMEFMLRLAVLYAEAHATSSGLEGVLIGSRLDVEQAAGPDIQSGFSKLQAEFGDDLFQRVRSINQRMAEVRKRNISGDYWHFWMLGVDPSLQGKGYGASLLKDVLARVDNEKLPCFLETHNEKNTLIYKRYGFGIAEDILLPETNIRHWAMIRPAGKQ